MKEIFNYNNVAEIEMAFPYWQSSSDPKRMEFSS